MSNLLYQATFIFTFVVIALITIRKSGRVKSSADFSVAGRSLSASGVAWVIIGTLVGGVSTIGTVQTAYNSGIGAGIFTFGSGFACFLLGLFFAKGLRDEGVVTVSEFLGKYFGTKFRYFASSLNSAGMFIHVVGQFLASIAILKSAFGFGNLISILLTLILIGIFVTIGGITGAGMIGKIKCIMLYLIMLLSAGVALSKGGGWQQIIANLPTDQNLLSLEPYGLKTATIDTLSMLVGVVSTQIYLQAIFSARDVRQARNGAYLAAVLIPPIGLLGIIIGLYLRAAYPVLDVSSSQALPYFFSVSFPPVVAAFFSAGILLIVLGTGAGLVLCVTTNLYNDIFSKTTGVLTRFEPLRLLRLTSLLVLIAAAALVVTGLDSTILKWSYMSMGLRGSAVFLGLTILVTCKSLHKNHFIRILVFCLPILYIIVSLLQM